MQQLQEMRIPEGIDAESSVIAALLYSPRSLIKIVDVLRVEHFYEDEHAIIYQAMLSLHAANRGSTILNVCDELKRTHKLDLVGGKAGVQDYVAHLDTYGSIEEAAAIVKRTSQMRRLYDAARQIAQSALEQDENALEQAEQLILDIALDSTVKPVATFSESIDRYLDVLEDRRIDFQNGTPGGTPTGLTELDKMLGGLWKSRLYTLAARPGFGKTGLALTIALNIASHAKHALFFSLEMDEDEIVQRTISAETEIDQSFLSDGDIDEDEIKHIHNVARRLRDYDLKIDDRTYLLADIRTKARAVHMRKPLDLIVVDYLQLIDVAPAGRGKNELRSEEVAKISKALKKLARELKVPVLALAQMNRDSEKRNNAVPQLSDLGESSGIEKDSDCVMFIYCSNDEQAKRENNEPYDLSIVLKKHRNGRLGSVPLRFRPKLTKFQDSEGPNFETDD